MDKKVSIIVPIFNSEKNLKRCLDSIVGQTYQNIELILIDDGSTDNSGIICDLYAQQDQRVKVIHKQNTGVSDSRNEGINLASGEYIQFVDSDDYMDTNMTETLIAAIAKNSAPMVICGFNLMDSRTDSCIHSVYWHTEMFYDYTDFLLVLDQMFGENLINSLWNKLYNAKTIKTNFIYFNNKLNYGEDLLFNAEVIKKCPSVEIITCCPYYYVQYYSGGTLTRTNHADMYEIQKLMFSSVLSLYNGYSEYSCQIKNLEKIYTEILITDTILHIANSYNFNNYLCYQNRVKNICSDVVLRNYINVIKPNYPQGILIKYLVNKRLFFMIYLFVKTKIIIKKRMPRIFWSLKKWGRRAYCV